MMWQDGVEDLLGRVIGLDPVTVGNGAIRRAVEIRMAALGLAFVGDYLPLIRSSDEEVQALIEEVVVPESWFFRDGQPFALLQRLIREGWLFNRDRAPARILSLPCAGGEEPYSVAMALLEVGLPAARFTIDAVDVSHRSLERAKRGLYGLNAFRGQDLPFRRRYFRPVGSLYELDPAVRGTVRFHCGNLLDPQLLCKEAPYDFLFFRNLLIYLTASARKQAMSTLERLLSPTGVLFSGHAESLTLLWPRFEPMSDVGTFAYRRVQESPGVKAPDMNGAACLASLPAPRPRDLRFAVAPAPVAPPKTVANSRPHIDVSAPAKAHRPLPSPHLERAAELANLRRYDEAVALCERSLRECKPTAESFYLLGTIHQAAGNLVQAEASFHKAVYLDGLHDEALLALALISLRKGDSATAAGFRRRAERAARSKGTA